MPDLDIRIRDEMAQEHDSCCYSLRDTVYAVLDHLTDQPSHEVIRRVIARELRVKTYD